MVLSTTLRIAALGALGLGLLHAQSGQSVSAELTQVVARKLEKTVKLPGELKPFQRVEIHAKVAGFVQLVNVDRGSKVKAGQLLATMTAPELDAQLAEVRAKAPPLEAQRSEAQANLAAAKSTLERLREAAKTPGVVAGNDVMLAEKAVEAQRSRVESLGRSVAAVEAAAHSIEEIKNYLLITAPFPGIITERYAHAGTLAGPASAGGTPLVLLEQMDRLRLEVPVPEAYIESIHRGGRITFTVPAYPGETFTGTVARPSHSVDAETRSMAVELDVANASGKLSPGMYSEVRWPVERRGESLFLPPSAVKSTTERTFVIRVTNGQAEWVDIRRGMTSGNMVEIFAPLEAGDTVVLRATDEIRPGTRVSPTAPSGGF